MRPPKLTARTDADVRRIYASTFEGPTPALLTLSMTTVAAEITWCDAALAYLARQPGGEEDPYGKL